MKECEVSLDTFTHVDRQIVLVVQEFMRTRARGVLWSVGCVCLGDRLPSLGLEAK